MRSPLRALAKITAQLGKKYFSPKKIPDLPQNPQRILWIRLDHIGDGVMNFPALAALRARFPQSQIDALIRPVLAPLLNETHLVDHVILGNSPRFPNSSGTAGRLKALWASYKWARKRRGYYDLAIDSRGDDVARFIAYWSKTPCRLGPNRIFYEPKNINNFSFLMTHLTPLPQNTQHAILTNVQNLSPLGVQETPFHWKQNEQSREYVTRFLQDLKIKGDFAVIQACTNDVNREWLTHKFAKVADYLITKYRTKVLLCGASTDVPYNTEIIRHSKHALQISDIAGEVPLQHLPAFLQQARIMVSVDTGPMHVGAMVGTPIVALMLPNLDSRHYPWKQKSGVISAPQGKLKNIEVAAVLKKIDAVMEASQGRF